jgi:hypothetical protein
MAAARMMIAPGINGSTVPSKPAAISTMAISHQRSSVTLMRPRASVL